MDFISREVALTAQPFHRFRVNLETATGLDYGKVIIPNRHDVSTIPFQILLCQSNYIIYMLICQEPGLKSDKNKLTKKEHMC